MIILYAIAHLIVGIITAALALELFTMPDDNMGGKAITFALVLLWPLAIFCMWLYSLGWVILWAVDKLRKMIRKGGGE